LAAAVKAQGGTPLDPVVVWHSGKHWYVIDGHHRLEAYHYHNETASERALAEIPVKVFEGSLAQAILVSAKENSRDKLPMRQEDKSNMAWRLVCLNDPDLTGKGIASAAGVSRQTVQTMRKAFRALCKVKTEAELLGISWAAARLLVKGGEMTEWDEDADEKQGAAWAERLGHEFGKALASNPRAAAYALRHYSYDLPNRLLETEVFEEAVEESSVLQMREEGLSDAEIYY
jgi:hypothetical protein